MVRANQQHLENEILFCGYRYDPHTGLFHVRFRMHNPTPGRWIQREPGGVCRGGTNLEPTCPEDPILIGDIYDMWQTTVSELREDWQMGALRAVQEFGSSPPSRIPQGVQLPAEPSILGVPLLMLAIVVGSGMLFFLLELGMRAMGRWLVRKGSPWGKIWVYGSTVGIGVTVAWVIAAIVLMFLVLGDT